MNKTKIDWADSTWNPVTGCLHGCEYCYARGIANRFGGHWDNERLRHFGANGEIHDLETPMRLHTTGKNRSIPVHSIQAPYPFNFDPTLHRYRLDDYKNKKGRTIFVCSMADLFGEWVPDEWIQEIFKACEEAPQHRYLFLTKNPKRYLELCHKKILPNKENYWIGTTITKPTDEFMYCNDTSYKTFVSIEPILEPFGGLETGQFPDWIIIGAETGMRKDKVIPEKWWIDEIVEQCKAANVPVFMKESLKNIMGNDFIQEFPWEV